MTKAAPPAMLASARLDDAVAFRLHRTNRLLLTHLARFLAISEHGLTPEKWFVLERLREHGPFGQLELVDAALVDGPNVSRLVDGLVKAELVERSSDPDDRRARILALSPRGRSLADELFERAVVERGLVFDGFSETELATFSAALDRIDTNVRAMLTAKPETG
jgi:DNA-binding MarR family transcriptional regulator